MTGRVRERTVHFSKVFFFIAGGYAISSEQKEKSESFSSKERKEDFFFFFFSYNRARSFVVLFILFVFASLSTCTQGGSYIISQPKYGRCTRASCLPHLGRR